MSPFFNLSGIKRFGCREGGTLLAESSGAVASDGEASWRQRDAGAGDWTSSGRVTIG